MNPFLVILFVVEKFTKRCARLVEEMVPGQPPLCNYIYLPLFFIGKQTKCKLNIFDNPPDTPHIVMKETKRTKNCVVYTAETTAGEPPTLESIYLPIWKMEARSVIYVTHELSEPIEKPMSEFDLKLAS